MASETGIAIVLERCCSSLYANDGHKEEVGICSCFFIRSCFHLSLFKSINYPDVFSFINKKIYFALKLYFVPFSTCSIIYSNVCYSTQIYFYHIYFTLKFWIIPTKNTQLFLTKIYVILPDIFSYCSKNLSILPSFSPTRMPPNLVGSVPTGRQPNTPEASENGVQSTWEIRRRDDAPRRWQPHHNRQWEFSNGCVHEHECEHEHYDSWYATLPKCTRRHTRYACFGWRYEVLPSRVARPFAHMCSLQRVDRRCTVMLLVLLLHFYTNTLHIVGNQ